METSSTLQFISSQNGNSLLHSTLVELLTHLKGEGYRFITVTPLTHQHYLRNNASGESLRDIFGWNLPFAIHNICPTVKRLMQEGDLIQACGEFGRSKLRISTLGSDLFLHSEFPTTAADAVFFGPDTYRFARFIRHSLEQDCHLFSSENRDIPPKPLRILDIGCGSGAGGITAARTLQDNRSCEIIMNDINVGALDLTGINAQVAGISAQLLLGDIFATIEGKFDVIISNPPYMSDPLGRTYRDGGAHLGLDLSIRIVKTALEHLAPGGRLLLYTGVAMTSDVDPFLSAIKPILASTDCAWSYEEIDPDVFGEELDQPSYSSAHRIAAVGLTVSGY